MCLLRVSHRRGVVSNKIFSRGIVHQLPPQREVWLGRNRHRARIRAPEMGLSAAAPVQRAGAEAGPRLLCPQRDQRAGWLIYAASRLCDAGLFAVLRPLRITTWDFDASSTICAAGSDSRVLPSGW